MKTFTEYLIEGKLEDTIWNIHGPRLKQHLDAQERGETPVYDDSEAISRIRHSNDPQPLFDHVRTLTGHSKYADNVLRAYGGEISHFHEDFPHYANHIREYHRLANLPVSPLTAEEKNFKSFPDLERFEHIVSKPEYQPFREVVPTKAQQKSEFEVKHEGTDADGHSFRLIEPKNHIACKAEGPSGLCTASPETFNHYNKLGTPLQIIQSKDPKIDKVQLHAQSGQIMGNKNTPFLLRSMKEKFPGLNWDDFDKHAQRRRDDAGAAGGNWQEQQRWQNHRADVLRQIRENPDVANEYLHHPDADYRIAVASANHTAEHNQLLMNDPNHSVRRMALGKTMDSKALGRAMRNTRIHSAMDLPEEERNAHKRQMIIGATAAANPHATHADLMEYLHRIPPTRYDENMKPKERDPGYENHDGDDPQYSRISIIHAVPRLNEEHLSKSPEQIKDLLSIPRHEIHSALTYAAANYEIPSEKMVKEKYQPGRVVPPHDAMGLRARSKALKQTSSGDLIISSEKELNPKSKLVLDTVQDPKFKTSAETKAISYSTGYHPERIIAEPTITGALIRLAHSAALLTKRKDIATDIVHHVIDKHPSKFERINQTDLNKTVIDEPHRQKILKYFDKSLKQPNKIPQERGVFFARSFPETHDQLKNHPNRWVQQAVAMSTKEPSILLDIMKTGSPIARHYVASRAIKAREGLKSEASIIQHPDYNAFDTAVARHMSQIETSKKVLDRWNGGKSGGKTHSRG